MTDFFTRLAGRTLGLMPTVKPVIPSRFGSAEAVASNERLGSGWDNDLVESLGDRTESQLSPSEVILPTSSQPRSMPLSALGQGNPSRQQSQVSNTKPPLPGEAMSFEATSSGDRTESQQSPSEISLPTSSQPRSMPLSEMGQSNLSREPSQVSNTQPPRQGKAESVSPVPASDKSFQVQVQRNEQDFSMKSPIFQVELTANQINSDSSSSAQGGNLESEHIAPTQMTPVKNQEVSESGNGNIVQRTVNAQFAASVPDLLESSQVKTRPNDFSEVQQGSDGIGFEEVSATQELIKNPVLRNIEQEIGGKDNRENVVPKINSKNGQEGWGEEENFAVLEPSHQSITRFPLSTTTPSVYSPISPVSGNTSTPTIRVSIGRVEVRAIMPTPPVSRPAAVRPSPSVSLNDYLKQRRGGG